MQAACMVLDFEIKFDFLLNRWDGNLHKYIIYLINKIVLMIHAGIQKIVQGGI